jgi:hypothetical protein
MDLMQEIENNRLVVDHGVGRVIFPKSGKIYECFVDLTIGVNFSFNKENYINYLEFNMRNLADSINLTIDNIDDITLEDFFEAIDMTYPFGDSDTNGIDAIGNQNSVVVKARKKAKTRAMINFYYFKLNKKKA